MKIKPEALGLAMSFNPFAPKISSNRNGMFALAMSQYQLPINGESPNIFTGYELTLPNYENNFGEILEDFEILEIIPQYSPILNMYTDFDFTNIKYQNYIVCGIHTKTNELTYYELRHYHKLDDQYGYVCKPLIDINQSRQKLKKGDKLYTSYNNDIIYGEYKFGCNANVLFADLIGTVEDAFVISERLANKLTVNEFRSINIKLNINEYLLNLYGDDENYKTFPDLNEKVKDSGILCAIRKLNDISILSDFNIRNLKKVNTTIDTVFYAEPETEIIDINVYISPKIIKNINKKYFGQVLAYHESKLKTYEKIISFYLKNKDMYYISRKFNTLITRMMEYLYIHNSSFFRKYKLFNIKKKNLDITGKIEDNDILIEIITKNTKKANIGNKIYGRDGAKGIIGYIAKDEDMPIDENGLQADLIIDPISVIARNNIGQIYEAYINRLSKIIKERSKQLLPSIEKRFNYILEFIKDINENQYNIIKSSIKTKKDIQEYLDYIDNNDIKIQIQSTMDHITPEFIIKLKEKYQDNISPVKFKVRFQDKETTLISKEICSIGNKFILLDYNKPEISSVNIGNVNTFLVPSNPNMKSRNYSYPIKYNCTRFGEDEFRMLITSLGPEIAIRIRTLSTGIDGISTVIQSILEAEKPSDIPYFNINNKQLLDSDVMINIIHTIFNSFGLDFQNVRLNNNDIKYRFKILTENIDLLHNYDDLKIDEDNEEYEDNEKCCFIKDIDDYCEIVDIDNI